jgi:hypothetical protein
VFIIESWVRVVIWSLSHKSPCEDHSYIFTSPGMFKVLFGFAIVGF